MSDEKVLLHNKKYPKTAMIPLIITEIARHVDLVLEEYGSIRDFQKATGGLFQV